jgi:hypothetical protein
MSGIPRKITAPRGLMLILLYVSAFFMNVAWAADSVGVKNGDWIRYDINVSYGGQTSTGSIKISIQQVQGVQVNGTYEVNVQGYSIIQPTPFSLNVSTGIGAYASGFIIPANLTAGQPIPGEAANVQSIVDWNGRRAVLANATSPFLGFYGQMYWDQQTGLLLESKGSASGAIYSIKEADTNLWSGGLLGGGWLTWVIIIVVIVVVVTVIAALGLRRRRTLPPVPSSLPQVAQPPPPPPPP